ncbi:hypothetical protein G7Y89_g1447 [Cudoniella acicularis]|uniref:SAM domain-containing protein n=1 Tax=Cudoniella acicularis TaxID=354080 RepID=A0A8H4RX85_9HELO|nr:hypothetical protein G7Y89_g1447 [Cudoniella acicularis]
MEAASPRQRKRKFSAISGTTSHEYRRITLQDFTLFKTTDAGKTLVWDFIKKAWTPWDPKRDTKAARDFLWNATREILRVQYFSTHLCEVKRLRKWIPGIYVEEAWSLEDWEKKIRWQQSLWDGQMIMQAIGYTIMPVWKERQGYPLRPFTEETKTSRMAFFLEQAATDFKALDSFMSTMAMSLDWKTISKKETDADNQLYDWAVRSLAVGANLMFELGIEAPFAESGKRLKPEETKKRHKEWLALSRNEKPPPYDETPLAEIFWASLSASDIEADLPSSHSESESGPEMEPMPKKRQTIPNPNRVSLSDLVGKARQQRSAKEAARSNILSQSQFEEELRRGKFRDDHLEESTSSASVRTSPSRELHAGPRATSQTRQNQHHPNIDPQASRVEPASVVPLCPPKNKSERLAILHQVNDNPKYTTLKVLRWNDEEISTWFESVMKVSPVDVRTFSSYQFRAGKLNGKVLLNLVQKDIIGSERLEIESQEARIRLWKIVRQFQNRVKRNDKELARRAAIMFPKISEDLIDGADEEGQNTRGGVQMNGHEDKRERNGLLGDSPIRQNTRDKGKGRDMGTERAPVSSPNHGEEASDARGMATI